MDRFVSPESVRHVPESLTKWVDSMILLAAGFQERYSNHHGPYVNPFDVARQFCGYVGYPVPRDFTIVVLKDYWRGQEGFDVEWRIPQTPVPQVHARLDFWRELFESTTVINPYQLEDYVRELARPKIILPGGGS
ncbi:hypothetical protein HY441_01935 [Candidatus Microgenomates bacterium]|nr:hypothetical protein [Candidatus Microgenomates bacterium]